jgi:hypothetical protein
MALITRGEKGSKLTIEEMDGNLVHLNNNPLLLGKITADLTLPVSSKIILITGCMQVTGTLFQAGETVTFKYAFEDMIYGTGVVASVAQYDTERCSRGTYRYVLYLEQLSFTLDDIPSLRIEGNTSGATASASSLEQVSAGPSQEITLNPNGKLFKINEILLTGISGTPADGTNCYVRTDEGIVSDQVAILSSDSIIKGKLDDAANALEPVDPSKNGGIGLLTDPKQWTQMEIRYYYLVGNTLYFSVDAKADDVCTVDVYVFGYTLE